MLLPSQNTTRNAGARWNAGPGTEHGITGAGSINGILARLPRAEPDLPEPLNPEETAGPLEILWPLPQPSRTAVLGEPVKECARVRSFPGPDAPGLENWPPDALAGRVETLCRLARERPASLSLSHCVIALITLRGLFLTAEVRELLWSAWRVPVFGQILGLSRELLAWECEAHEGYHFDPGRVIFEPDRRSWEPELLVTSLQGPGRPALRLATCLTGGIESSRCGCGLSGPRLVEVRPVRQRASAAVAGAWPRPAMLR
ncbi:MAG: hypothetical protein IT159_08825 [Bryobacterales bacterium]|nr:hypothetical protein [Bryobacterales bacterium]